MHGQSSHSQKGGQKGKKVEDAALVRAAQRFLEGQKELAAANKLVAVKKGTLLLPTRQEGTVAEGWGQVRSQSVVESEDEGAAAQMTPITRDKQCRLEAETVVAVVIEVKGLVTGKEDNNNNDNGNNNNNNREETPLAERVVVAKAIARSLSEGETEAGPEAGLGDDR